VILERENLSGRDKFVHKLLDQVARMDECHTTFQVAQRGWLSAANKAEGAFGREVRKMMGDR